MKPNLQKASDVRSNRIKIEASRLTLKKNTLRAREESRNAARPNRFLHRAMGTR